VLPKACEISRLGGFRNEFPTGRTLWVRESQGIVGSRDGADLVIQIRLLD